MTLKTILVCFLFFSLLQASPLKQEQEKEKKQELKIKYEVKPSSLTAKDSDMLFSSSIHTLDFKLAHTVCGKVYENKMDSKGNVVKKGRFTKPVSVPYRTILEDFNPETGVFKCRYSNPSIFTKKGIVAYVSIPEWKSRIKMIELDNNLGVSVLKSSFRSLENGDWFSGDYYIKNIDQFVENKTNVFNYRYNKTNFNVYEHATNLGLWVSANTDISKQERGFTLSQFIINLITLNSSVVTGVDGYGNIKINKDIARRLTILHEQDGDGFGLSDLTRWKDNYIEIKLKTLFLDDKSKNVARKKYTDVNSFAQYFDYQLFGMYYNFMGIAWSNIFSYASMLFLSFMVLYSASIVGVKYGMHKLDENNKGKPFEFPAKIRLVSIGTVLVLSFVQFPTGEGTKITTSKDSKAEIIFAQTSIAKIAISYLGNIGTVVADISAGDSETVYLDYLLKATNSRSYQKIKENIQDYETEVAIQAVRVAFYSKECLSPYMEKKFKVGNTFQGVNAYDISNWVWNGDSKAKKIFADNSGELSVSPYLCKNLEKDIAITRTVLKEDQQKIESDMNGRLKRAEHPSSQATELSTLFVITQLQASKSLGWINIASLPILHVFMMSSGILGEHMSVEKRDGAMKTMMLDSTLHNTNVDVDKLNREAKDYLKGQKLDGLFNSGKLDDFFVWAMSKQVYTMLPGFDDMRLSIQDLVKGGASLLIDLVSDLPFAKPLKVAKKLLNIGFDVKGNQVTTAAGAAILYLISFALAIMIYKLMLTAIFGGMVSLLIILKIVLYFVDVFAYFFVSPLIIGWKLTINDRTDRVHRYITSGFVLLTLRPTLIVFSSVMFIIAYEIMLSVYSLSFDMIFSSLELANELYDESDIGSLIMMGAIKGFGEVMILVFGMILAYQIILNGDDLILQKFGYKDDTDNGMANQIGNKIQGIAGGKI